MSKKSKSQKSARALQERTGWSYQHCLHCTRTMTPDAIEALIKIRAGQKENESP